MFSTRNSCDRPRVSVQSMFLLFVVSVLLCCTTGAVAQVEEGPVPGKSCCHAYPSDVAALRLTQSAHSPPHSWIAYQFKLASEPRTGLHCCQLVWIIPYDVCMQARKRMSRHHDFLRCDPSGCKLQQACLCLESCSKVQGDVELLSCYA